MKGKLPFLLMGILVAGLAFFVGGRLPYFLLYVYSLAVLLPMGHSLLGTFFLKGEITLPAAELAAGENITVKYLVKNPSLIPFPHIEVENDFGYRLTGVRDSRKVFSLQAKDWREEQTVLPCRRRGFYELGSIRLIIRDILNMAAFKKTITARISLKVYPRVEPIHSFRIIASQQMGHLKVKDPLFRDYAELADLRQYREGDPVKRIHWKVSARKEELMVKHFEERGDTEVMILLDSFRDHYREDTEGWTEDQLVEAAASVIDYCLKRNIRVTLCCHSQGKEVQLQGDLPASLKHFLDGLALFHPTAAVSFDDQMDHWTTRLQQGTALLLMTPVLTTGLAARGIRLKRKNIHPAFLVFGDTQGQPEYWRQHREIGRKAALEGVSVYLFDRGQSVRDVLEGTHASGIQTL